MEHFYDQNDKYKKKRDYLFWRLISLVSFWLIAEYTHSFTHINIYFYFVS